MPCTCRFNSLPRNIFSGKIFSLSTCYVVRFLTFCFITNVGKSLRSLEQVQKGFIILKDGYECLMNGLVGKTCMHFL